jgi:uncharacterized protein YndB with AHSA1/START domain
MSITSLDTDYDNLALTGVLDFDAPVDKVWQLWADPRKLERWWGPPEYPATVEEHDLTPGGRVTYFMTGPDGQKYHGYWSITSVDAPKALELHDGFAHGDGSPDEEMPVTFLTVRLAERPDGGTRVEMRSSFDSREQMDQLVAMGMVEGIRGAAGQMDALLAA